MTQPVSYNGRKFRSVANSASGQVSAETIFHYHERDNMVWAEYQGGGVIMGMLLATKSNDGTLDMRYQHISARGELMTGTCRSRLEVLADGRYRLHEKWQWTCGDQSSGKSMIEEIA